MYFFLFNSRIWTDMDTSLPLICLGFDRGVNLMHRLFVKKNKTCTVKKPHI